MSRQRNIGNTYDFDNKQKSEGNAIDNRSPTRNIFSTPPDFSRVLSCLHTPSPSPPFPLLPLLLQSLSTTGPLGLTLEVVLLLNRDRIVLPSVCLPVVPLSLLLVHSKRVCYLSLPARLENIRLRGSSVFVKHESGL